MEVFNNMIKGEIVFQEWNGIFLSYTQTCTLLCLPDNSALPLSWNENACINCQARWITGRKYFGMYHFYFKFKSSCHCRTGLDETLVSVSKRREIGLKVSSRSRLGLEKSFLKILGLGLSLENAKKPGLGLVSVSKMRTSLVSVSSRSRKCKQAWSRSCLGLAGLLLKNLETFEFFSRPFMCKNGDKRYVRVESPFYFFFLSTFVSLF